MILDRIYRMREKSNTEPYFKRKLTKTQNLSKKYGTKKMFNAMHWFCSTIR